MRLIPLALALTTLAAGLALPPGPATAQQNLFAPRLTINGHAITNYEFQQRRLFMQLLGAPGDLDRLAEDGLIEDRLRMADAQAIGLELEPEHILAGMTEFAGRVELSAEEFIEALEANGVAGETFRDFVRAGMIWREVLGARFGAYADTITEAEIDRALSVEAQHGVMRVRLSEIVLPRDARELAEELAGQVGSEGAFAAAASQHSTAPSAARGGRLDWVPAANLSPAALGALSGLTPGQVTPPVRLDDGWAIYRLHEIDSRDAITDQMTAVEYARYLIPGAGSTAAGEEAARIRARVNTCTDLYGVARGQPEERLTITSTLLPALPAGLAAELALLDPGESSTRLVEGDAMVFLMLCSRRVASDLPPSRDTVRDRLVNERIGSMAELRLRELRANADIRRP